MIDQLFRDFNARAATDTDSLDNVQALAVCAPRDEDEAKRAILFCAHHKIAIVPRGGATKLHIGAPPSRPFVVLSSENLTQIFDHDEGNATVSAGSGISLGSLDVAVGERGQFVPLDASEDATLGGLMATNNPGAWKTKYGAPRDLIVGFSAILSDGRTVENRAKVVKNVAGYDLPKIFTGTFGTLGFITRVTIRLRPRDAATFEWSARFNSLAEAETQAAQILDGAFEPTLLQIQTNRDGASVRARFDGGETAVASQQDRLPASQNVETESPNAPFEIAATLPLRAATNWAQAANEQALNIVWDFALGRVVAHFQSAPDISSLRALAESAGGFCVVTRAPEKSTELVWGAPRGDWVLQQSLKAKYDEANVFALGRFVGGL